MNAYLDLIASFLIGALLLLNVQRMNANLVERSYKTGNEYAALSGATTWAEILEEDLQKVGYGVTGSKVSLADSTRLTFRSDIDRDGDADSVRYVLGGSASRTANPRDRLFNRMVNAESPDSMSLGVTDVHFTYFDSTGATTPTLTAIKGIQADITVQSTVPYDTSYAESFVRVKVWPKNL